MTATEKRKIYDQGYFDGYYSRDRKKRYVKPYVRGTLEEKIYYSGLCDGRKLHTQALKPSPEKSRRRKT